MGGSRFEPENILVLFRFLVYAFAFPHTFFMRFKCFVAAFVAELYCNIKLKGCADDFTLIKLMSEAQATCIKQLLTVGG